MEMGVLPPESSNNLEQLGTTWNTQLHHEQNTPKLTEHPTMRALFVNTSRTNFEARRTIRAAQHSSKSSQTTQATKDKQQTNDDDDQKKI